DIEAAGYALPLTDLQISYIAPARYDDVLSIMVGVVDIGHARLQLGYHVLVAPGDRKGLSEPLTIAFAETCHCCIARADGRPMRFPGQLAAALANLAKGPEGTD